MSNSRSHYWPAAVDDAISKLHYMDSVTIIWVDASQSSNVPIPKKGGAFANHSIETRVSSAGQFIRTQEGDAYNDSHIIILKDISDQRRGTIQAIPLALVKQIVINGHGKEQLISLKRAGQLIKQSISAKSKTWNKDAIHFSDGSTKHIGDW